MKKIISILLAFIILSSYIKVEAAENTVSSEGNISVQVTADLSSVFEVRIPTELSISEYADYTFDIIGKGRISNYEFLDINLPKVVAMTSSDNQTEDVKLYSDNEGFLNSDLQKEEGSSLCCTMNTMSLPSGHWTGDFDVNISVKDLCYLNDSVSMDTLWYKTIVRNNETGEIIYYSTKDPFYFMDTKDYIYNDIEGMTCITYKRNSNGEWQITSGYMKDVVIDIDDYTIIHNNYNILDNMLVYVYQSKQCLN